jgi:hypothetical protein
MILYLKKKAKKARQQSSVGASAKLDNGKKYGGAAVTGASFTYYESQETFRDKILQTSTKSTEKVSL